MPREGDFFSFFFLFNMKCVLGLSIHKGSSDFDGLLIFTSRLAEEEIFSWCVQCGKYAKGTHNKLCLN